MCSKFWQLVILIGVVRSIHAGVKIEISRVKDPPKVVSSGQNVDSNKTQPNETGTTVMTTLPTPEAATSTSTTPRTESNEIKLTSPTNFASTSSMSTSTAATLTTASQNATELQNGTGLLNPDQTNLTSINNTLLKNVSKVATGVIPRDLSPYLAEYTRRQMRRQLMQDDYYCPCDLKVKTLNEKIN